MEDITKVAPVDDNSNAPADLQEEWRLIDDPRIKSMYEISNLGRARNINTGHILTPYADRTSKYYTINFVAAQGGTHRFYAHYLVARYFLVPPKEDQTQIDHIDGNRCNNSVTNLRWVTPKENANNEVTRKRYLNTLKARISKQHVPVQCIETGEVFESLKAAADYFHIASCTITSSCKSYEADKKSGTKRRRVKAAKHFRYVPVDLPTANIALAETASTVSARRIPIRCIEDGIIYPSISAAAKAYHIAPASIYTALRHTKSGVFSNKHKGLRHIRHFEVAEA